MIFLHIFILILILKPTNSKSYITSSNIELLQSIINLYNITEVKIGILEDYQFRIENLLDSIWKLNNTTFNIHTNLEVYQADHHNKELLIVTTESFRKLKYLKFRESSSNTRYIAWIANDSEVSWISKN